MKYNKHLFLYYFHQTEGDDANIDINAAGDVGNSAKAIIESRVVEEPRQNIQSKNQQESTCSLLVSITVSVL